MLILEHTCYGNSETKAMLALDDYQYSQLNRKLLPSSQTFTLKKKKICHGALFIILKQENVYNPFNSVNCGKKEIVLSLRFQKGTFTYSIDALFTL